MLPKKTFLAEILTFGAMQLPINTELYNRFITELSTVYDKGEASAITRIYFEDALHFKKSELYNSPKHKKTAINIPDIENDLARLKNFEPVQYVTGKTIFCGLPFNVNKYVLIPRPETEELVYWIIDRNRQIDPVIIDLCTGSGCIAVSLAQKLNYTTLFATDVSDKALDLARFNAQLNNTIISFAQDDILKSNINVYPKEADIFVSNPPYIPIEEKGSLDKNVVEYEPHLALFSLKNAFIFYERISSLATKILKPGGYLYFEIHQKGALRVAQIMRKKGFEDIAVKKDLHGNERMICGVLKNKYF